MLTCKRWSGKIVVSHAHTDPLFHKILLVQYLAAWLKQTLLLSWFVEKIISMTAWRYDSCNVLPFCVKIVLGCFRLCMQFFLHFFTSEIFLWSNTKLCFLFVYYIVSMLWGKILTALNAVILLLFGLTIHTITNLKCLVIIARLKRREPWCKWLLQIGWDLTKGKMTLVAVLGALCRLIIAYDYVILTLIILFLTLIIFSHRVATNDFYYKEKSICWSFVSCRNMQHKEGLSSFSL